MKRLLALSFALCISGVLACGDFSDTGGGGDTQSIGFTRGLAYVKTGDIYVADASDFENKTQRLTTEGGNGMPAVSRDGKRVAFVHTDVATGAQALSVVPAAGGNVSVLVALQSRSYAGLAFSGDGQLLFFAASNGLFRIEVTGANETRLQTGSGWSSPSVASDGTLWALDGASGTFFNLGPAGGGTPVAGLIGLSGQRPVRGSINPAGNRIAFEDATSHEIFVGTASGGSATQLTRISSGQQSWPVWSGDGTEVVFVSNAGGAEKIYAASATASMVGGSLLQVGNQPGWGG